MSGMTNHENNFNRVLGEVLKSRRKNWKSKRVHAEMQGSIKGGKRADILIFSDELRPVVIEAAYESTPNIDEDAIGRLREEAHGGSTIMTAIALKIPKKFQSIEGDNAIKKALLRGGNDGMGEMLEYAVYSVVGDETYGDPDNQYDVRYPAGERGRGYIKGTAADLADLIELAATPDIKIKEVAKSVAHGIQNISYTLLMIDELDLEEIAARVGQPCDEHAARVAACLWLNALLLHDKLSSIKRLDIISPFECRNVGMVIEQWNKILAVDYNSVFSPARDTLNYLRRCSGVQTTVLDILRRLVDEIKSLKLGQVADISSDIFPILATDRAVTASFYTLMEVAELLSGVAFNLLPKEWKDSDISVFHEDGVDTPVNNGLRIADFACGTGALLKAAYRQVRRRAEPKRGMKMGVLHKNYMENSLYGADIQPIATHLTVAGLAMASPSADYDHSNVICADIRNGLLGSLDLLDVTEIDGLLEASAFKGVDKDPGTKFRPTSGSFDMCIMNPPYTRTRKGRRVFGVQGLDDYDREKSQKRLGKILKNTFANMKAGLGSAFCHLANNKLKQGGVLATVLPATAASQGSWEEFRAYITSHYKDIIVIGIASEEHQSFSADTDIAEILLCARKGAASKKEGKITFVNLHNVPRDFVEANEIVRALRDIQNSDAFGELRIGEHVFATCIKTSTKVWRSGEPWGSSGVRSATVAQVAQGIIKKAIVLPGHPMGGKFGIKVSALSEHLEIGPTHHLIGDVEEKGKDNIGVFRIHEIPERGPRRINLALWGADAKAQSSIICEPTHYGEIKPGRENDVERIVNRNSTLFLARNLRLNSQKIVSAMTNEKYMGGSSWTSLCFGDEKVYKAYCLWFNSIFGLLPLWYCGGRQQSGRVRVQIGDISNLPCPEFSGKSASAKKAVKIANEKFDELDIGNITLLPCSYAWLDEERKKIDDIVLEMLGIKKAGGMSERNIQALREQWCQEPSVHGGHQKVLKALKKSGLLA